MRIERNRPHRTPEARAGLAVILALLWVTVPLAVVAAQEPITDAEAKDHADTEQTVCGQIVSIDFVRDMEGQPTFLVFGKPYPEQSFAIVIWGEHRRLFRRPPERLYRDKSVCATGLIEMLDGKPRMAVEDPEAIAIQEDESA